MFGLDGGEALLDHGDRLLAWHGAVLYEVGCGESRRKATQRQNDGFFSLVNSHAHDISERQLLWEIDFIFAPGLPFEDARGSLPHRARERAMPAGHRHDQVTPSLRPAPYTPHP